MEWSLLVWLLCHRLYPDGSLTLDRNAICSQAQGRIKEMGQLWGLGSGDFWRLEVTWWWRGIGNVNCSYVAVKNSPGTEIKARFISFQHYLMPRMLLGVALRWLGWGSHGYITRVLQSLRAGWSIPEPAQPVLPGGQMSLKRTVLDRHHTWSPQCRGKEHHKRDKTFLNLRISEVLIDGCTAGGRRLRIWHYKSVNKFRQNW